MGQRQVKVAQHRTSQDWADFIRELVDAHYPKAERIVLVMDNLNTHTPSSLYQTFPPAEARRLLEKLEIHYTPVHGAKIRNVVGLMSWIILDIIALSFYSRLMWQLSVLQLVHAIVGPLPYDYNTACHGFESLSWTVTILVLLDILIGIGMFVVGPIGVITSGIGILQVLITRHVDWLKRGSILLLVGFASIVALVIWARITFALGVCSQT